MKNCRHRKNVDFSWLQAMQSHRRAQLNHSESETKERSAILLSDFPHAPCHLISMPLPFVFSLCFHLECGFEYRIDCIWLSVNSVPVAHGLHSHQNISFWQLPQIQFVFEGWISALVLVLPHHIFVYLLRNSSIVYLCFITFTIVYPLKNSSSIVFFIFNYIYNCLPAQELFNCISQTVVWNQGLRLDLQICPGICAVILQPPLDSLSLICVMRNSSQWYHAQFCDH